MCYYCKNKKLVTISVAESPIATEDKTFIEKLRINGHKINNCPMCGRSLEK